MLELKHKISDKKALDNSVSCNGFDAVFICADGEDAIDLIMHVGKRLVVMQLKLYFQL